MSLEKVITAEGAEVRREEMTRLGRTRFVFLRVPQQFSATFAVKREIFFWIREIKN
jgi:hypothetical protein